MRRTEYLTEKRDFHKLPASLLMEQDVKFCRPSDSARHIASELTKHNFGSLPVVENGGMLVGLVSEFDLLGILMKDRDPKDVRAEEIMTRDVKFVREDTSVDEIIRLLEADHLIRVPVVRDGKLVGIVARRDILFGFIKSTAQYWP
ncbi:MAG TPA: CBS domain-containing protein [Nitrospiria bacterium]|jgi:CBS domain-containing protein|nr:CBS domain-containing protein [Nitrospiria bacterium]